MKTIKIILVIIVIIFAVDFAYLQYGYYTFVDRTVKSQTNIEKFKIISKVHDDQQWYAKVLIDKSDGEKLIKRYPFKYGYKSIDLAGRYQNIYIKNKPNCWYYFNGRGQGPYGYIIYCLNNDKTQLEVYDLFGD